MAKRREEMTDEELKRAIVFAHLDGIIQNAERLTSGNFMHNRASIMLSAKIVRNTLNELGIKDVE